MQAQSNRSSSTKTNLIIDIVISVAFLVATAPHFTGIAIHEWLGISFGALIITHLLLHWAWLVETTRRIFTSAPRQARINYLLNTVLFIDITLVIFSGLMISESALPLLGITVSPGFLWRSLHTFTANLAVFIIGLHVALHWGWLTHSVGRYVVKPLGNLLWHTGTPHPTQKGTLL
jgi:hypothetical protein